MHPHNGALLHVLCNREYRIHHHSVRAPFHPNGLPEAWLPSQLTHPGGGACIAYKKHAPWASLVTPLTLPQSCPRATTCAVELTLRDGLKAAIISCYLPQTTEEHATICDALTKLPGSLPHSLIIMGGIFEVDGTHHPQRMHTSQHYLINDGKGPCSPPSYRARGPPRRHASTTSPSGTRKVSRFKRTT